eukprot:Gb_12427 [translate_table: standard]
MGSHTLTAPQFDGSHQLGIFLVSSGLPWKAWEACTTAYKTPKPFVVREVEDVVFFAFPSFELTVRDFMLSGSTESADLFTHLKDNNDEPALMHRPFLSRFLHVLNNSDFQDKVELAQNKRQSIVFTGHSVGGAVAALATLWILGKQQRRNLPFCVTFGCPLLGDEKLAQAVRREKWCGQFCHTVSQHDIIPRIFLAAPTLDQSLTHSPLKALLPYWCSSMTNCHPPNEVPLSNEQISIFFTNVVKQISGIVKYVSMATTNTLIDGVEPNDALINGIENLRPYRPFGSYLFCSENGAAYIENTVAVLQMLYFTMQATHKSPDPIAKAYILEHIGYGGTLAHIMRNLVNVGGLSRGNIVLVDKDPYEVGIEMALEAAGIGIQQAPAREALIAAGKIGIRPSLNSAKQAVQLAKIQGARVEIEWYKLSCERDKLGYYDSFKIQKEAKDFRANLNRLKLERFWEEIIDMVEKHELPDDFQYKYKWINASTTYRQLVEPLDIADYYRKGKHKKFGHYLDIGNEHGRPRRYKVLQKWFEDIQRKQGQRVIRTQLAYLTQDSCFWARLEEAREWLDAFKENQDAFLLDKMQQFACHVQNLIDCRDVSCDVLLEKGSFIKWWKEYTEVQRALLPSSSVMDCEMQRLSIKP